MVLNVSVNIPIEMYVDQEVEYVNIIEIQHQNILDKDPATDASASKTKSPFLLYQLIKLFKSRTMCFQKNFTPKTRSHMSQKQ